MNGLILFENQVNLAKYPPETAKILQRDIFLYFKMMKTLCQDYQ